MINNLSPEEKAELKDHYKSLQGTYKYNIEQFDQQALFISSGALAISLAFIKDIVPLNTAINLLCFYISIILFGTSIIIGFVAFLISSELTRKSKKDVGNYIEKGKIENKIVQDKITHPLLYVNASIIVLGIIFVIIFAITNIQHYKDNFNSYNKGKPQNQVEQSK